MIDKHMKRCSATQIIREEQVKTTVRFRFAFLRMATTKEKQRRENVGVDVVELKSLCTLGGKVKWCSH